jgi:hypothetical protein
MIKSRRIIWAVNVERMGGINNSHEILVEKTEGKRTIGKPRQRWEDDVEMDLKEIILL